MPKIISLFLAKHINEPKIYLEWYSFVFLFKLQVREFKMQNDENNDKKPQELDVQI